MELAPNPHYSGGR